jgi:three-Cys-motif partner protein
LKPLTSPIWTENKARLIERYLYYFVLVTKHGTYIDGFAGPQEPDKPDMWAAKLVLETEPRWLRNFYLFDQDASQYQRLLALKKAQPPPRPRTPRRKVEVRQGDFNQCLGELLASGAIRDKEATFCLLDQRTFECCWSTVEALARHKNTDHKIELFYFLPIGWLGRALAAQKDTSVLAAWWGRDDWAILRRPMDPFLRATAFAQRFKDDLGYGSVKPWPIYDRQGSARIMYFMIHATDHPAAPGLMRRAYEKAVSPKEPLEQLRLEDLQI